MEKHQSSIPAVRLSGNREHQCSKSCLKRPQNEHELESVRWSFQVALRDLIESHFEHYVRPRQASHKLTLRRRATNIAKRGPCQGLV